MRRIVKGISAGAAAAVRYGCLHEVQMAAQEVHGAFMRYKSLVTGASAKPAAISAMVLALSTALASHQAIPDLRRQGSGGLALRDRIQSYLDDWRAASTFPGASVGIVLKDGTSFGVVTGVSDRTQATPMRVEDLLLAGSTGKTFFAAVAVQLIE